jgi:hypothetical protein
MNTCDPISTRSPCATVRTPLIETSLTRTPLRLPLSSTVTRPGLTWNVACRRDARESSIAMSQLASRPTTTSPLSGNGMSRFISRR